MGKENKKIFLFLTFLTLPQCQLGAVWQIKLPCTLTSNPQSPIKYPQSPLRIYIKNIIYFYIALYYYIQLHQFFDFYSDIL